MSSPFEYVAYCHRGSTGNSVKIVAVKDIKQGDHLFVSVREFDRAMSGNKFVAKIYRLNKGVPEQHPFLTIRQADPLKLKLNLYGDE